jgi:hypothetical protein
MSSKPAASSERRFAAAVKIAERFPGIEAEGWLAIKCDFIDREILLQAAPHVFHLSGA